MENLTHSLAGVLLGKAGVGRGTALATPALLLGANLPDVDIFATLVGWNYLDVHRGSSHGAAGIAVLSVALTAALWIWGRWRRPARPPRFAPLWLASFAGLASHPLLDALNDYGVRPWLPFHGGWYYGDLIGVVDPWMWILFGVGAADSKGPRVLRALWLCLAAVLAIAVAFGAGFAFTGVWLAALALAAFGASWLAGIGRAPARWALLLFAVYLGATALGRQVVLDKAIAGSAALIKEPVRKIEVLPAIPNRFVDWRVVVETGESFYLGIVGLHDWQSRPPALDRFARNLDHACYRAALSDSGMAAMSRFARFPSADVRVEGATCVVFLRDLRYARHSVPGWGVAYTRVALP